MLKPLSFNLLQITIKPLFTSLMRPILHPLAFRSQSDIAVREFGKSTSLAYRFDIYLNRNPLLTNCCQDPRFSKPTMTMTVNCGGPPVAPHFPLGLFGFCCMHLRLVLCLTKMDGATFIPDMLPGLPCHIFNLRINLKSILIFFLGNVWSHTLCRIMKCRNASEFSS